MVKRPKEFDYICEGKTLAERMRRLATLLDKGKTTEERVKLYLLWLATGYFITKIKVT